MKKSLAVLCAVWIAFVPNIALAQVPATTDADPASGKQFGRVGIYDASKVLRTTEEYPYQLQNDMYPAADTTTVVFNGVIRPVGLAWSVSPFGARNVLVTLSRNGVATRLKLYLYGSDDGTTFFPVMAQTGVWTITDSDSNKADTLQAVIGTQQFPGANGGSNTVRQFKLPLPEDVYYGRYVQIWAARFDSAFTAAQGQATHIGLKYEGRWR